MQDVNVLVVFYSRYGSTERLALAAAVGAVQGRANIRLRRWADSGEASVDWKEHRDRMNKEYVAPRDSDVEWADAILLGIPGDGAALSTDIWIREQKLAGKIVAPFVSNPGVAAVCAAVSGEGVDLLPGSLEADALTAARMQGRKLAEAAHTRRGSLPKPQL